MLINSSHSENLNEQVTRTANSCSLIIFALPLLILPTKIKGNPFSKKKKKKKRTTLSLVKGLYNSRTL